jgi:hypothetical protein
VLLDRHGVARELQDLFIAQREPVSFRLRHFNGAGRLAGGCGRAEHHLFQLRAQGAAHDGGFPLLEHRLVDVELVGVHGPLHHCLSQPVGRGDEHHVAEARFGVEREHDASRAEVAPHHLLHGG